MSYTNMEIRDITNNLISYCNKCLKGEYYLELREDKRELTGYSGSDIVLFYELYLNNVYVFSDKDLKVIKDRVYIISAFLACQVEADKRKSDKND